MQRLRRRSVLRPLVMLLLAFVAACDGGDDAAANAGAPPGAPGLEPSPRWLTFRCVTPGCDESQAMRFTVTGDRRLAVKRIVLDETDRADFVLELPNGRRPPFILGVEEFFEVTVRHLPTTQSPREGATLIVTYGDASDNDEAGRVEPTNLEIPLVRRVVGEPTIRPDPARLVFGAVAPGAKSTETIHLWNDGSGNAALAVAEVLSDVLEITVETLPVVAALPGESLELPITFAPRREAFVAGKLLVRATDPGLAPVEIEVAGTSIVAPSLAFEPLEGLDFGDVPKGSFVQKTLRLVNQGGGGVMVNTVTTAGTYPGVQLPGEPALPFAVEALGTAELTVTLDATTPGPIAEQLSITSNGSFFPLVVPVIGLVTEPDLEVQPVTLDFGTVPRGWNARQTIELHNEGWGTLEITNLSMVLGSSELFAIAELPTLPARLERGDRLPVQLEFRAQGEAVFTARLAVESDDPDEGFFEVTMTGQGATCDSACTIPFATPQCLGGECSIASCDLGRYDADGEVTNGCECLDPSADPGSFCAEGVFLGSLSDEGGRANHAGAIPTADDIDFIRFHGADDSQFWGDEYDVRIQLDASDPTISMCVYRHDAAAHQPECVLENEQCGIRSYSRGGDSISEDGADYTVKIFRQPNAASACSSYTLSVSNG